MAGASDIKAGRAFVEIGARDKTGRVLNAVARKLHGWANRLGAAGAAVTALGGAITGPIFAAAKAFGAMGDQMAKASIRTGVSVEALSELSFAAGRSGAGFEVLENSLRQMQKRIGEPGELSEETEDALASLGLTLADLAGKLPEDQFATLAGRIGEIEDPTRKAAVAMALFGRSGTQMIPLFNEGVDGIEALREKARELGLQMSTKDAQAAEVFSDAVEDVASVLKMAAFQIGASVAPMLTTFADAAAKGASAVTGFIAENRGLVMGAFLAGGAITAAGGALLVFAGALKVAAVGIGVLQSSLAITKGLVIALTNPLLALPIAIVGVGAVMAASSEQGQKAFFSLKEVATETLTGIQDALAAGDFQTAAEIGLLGLKAVWHQITGELQDAWADLSLFVVESIGNALIEVQNRVKQAQSSIAQGLLDLAAEGDKSFLGGFAEFIVGRDVSADIRKAEELNRKAIALGLPTQAGPLEQAKADLEAQTKADTEEFRKSIENLLAGMRQVTEDDKTQRQMDIAAERERLMATLQEQRSRQKQEEATRGTEVASGAQAALTIARDLPKAVERGSVEAARQAYANRQTQSLSTIAGEAKKQTGFLRDIADNTRNIMLVEGVD